MFQRVQPATETTGRPKTLRQTATDIRRQLHFQAQVLAVSKKERDCAFSSSSSFKHAQQTTTKPPLCPLLVDGVFDANEQHSFDFTVRHSSINEGILTPLVGLVSLIYFPTFSLRYRDDFCFDIWFLKPFSHTFVLVGRFF